MGNMLGPNKGFGLQVSCSLSGHILLGKDVCLEWFPISHFSCKHTSCISSEPWSKTGYCHWYVSLSCLLCVSHLTGMFNSPSCHVFLESSYLDRSQRDAGQTRTPRVIFQDISILRERHWGAQLSFITNKQPYIVSPLTNPQNRDCAYSHFQTETSKPKQMQGQSSVEKPSPIMPRALGLTLNTRKTQ